MFLKSIFTYHELNYVQGYDDLVSGITALTFSTLAPDADEWSVLSPSRFIMSSLISTLGGLHRRCGCFGKGNRRFPAVGIRILAHESPSP
jgi:hypothetical protein